ncbi:forkhead-associated domain-containing protein 1 [Octopus bimaculoides]|uniref:FHA domain-containing protein n=1 Tax=Octopus bimaculoides TaxID=37653 RepID=A0A0L8IDF5_OCTBM|nr:forkhead-associated domain-containing protein 1 [Octopus bimaculoides]XP_014774856.1 forkhead-associated domain-containing protein 1 [Octopus bimaculoides]|eukprot:XP_014774847.1 PREDICTED: forkhead-associated domain-containing protein 1-like [Octopus bimaculoides]
MAQAYLRNSEGYCFPLSQKITTIGREGCDIVIQLPTIDTQHAMVEFNMNEGLYILTDLNSLHGTFVNEVKVQNSSVRLHQNDIIQFGANGHPYELFMCNSPMVTCSEIRPLKKTAWSQTKKNISTENIFPLPSASSLPHLSPAPYQTKLEVPTSMTTWSTVAENVNNGFGTRAATGSITPPWSFTLSLPQNRFLQKRPSETSRRIMMETRTTSTQTTNVYSTQGDGYSLTSPSASSSYNRTEQPINFTQEILNSSYTIHPPRDHMFTNKNNSCSVQNSTTCSMKLLRDQCEQQHVENKSEMKDESVELQPKCRPVSSSTPYSATARYNDNQPSDFCDGHKTVQVLKVDSKPDPSSVYVKNEMDNKARQLSKVQIEVDQLRKDKNIITGLVSQLQREVSNKDGSILKLTRELETLKKESWKKETNLQQLTTKLSKVKDGAKAVETSEVREKEIRNLQNNLMLMEKEIEQKNTLVGSQQVELVDLKKLVSEQREDKRQTGAEMEKVQSELEDMKRAERMVRIDLEKAVKKMECFRSRVLQAIFSVPGSEIPKKEVSDDDLIEMLKKMATAESKVKEKLAKMQDKVNDVYKQKEEFIKDIHQLETGFQESVERMKNNGLQSCLLSQEIKLLKSVSTEKNLLQLKTLFEQMVKIELDWQQKIEESLEKCGINVNISTEDPAKHIDFLHKKWSLALEENTQLKSRISKNEENQKLEVQSLTESLQQEAQERLKEAVEKSEQQGMEELNKAVEEVKQAEADKQEELLKNEEKKFEELNSTIIKLKELINSKDQETQNRLEEVNKVWSQNEELKVCKTQLESELEEQHKIHQSEKEQLEADVQTTKSQSQVDISEYREQIKQHSITICSLEEKLSKAKKLNGEYSDRITQLQDDLHEERTKLPANASLPLKPKIIIQKPPQAVLELEREIAALRAEILQLKHVLQEKDNIIVKQRRDIVEAYARLSDMAGELSEDNKEEIELSRQSVNRHMQEMIAMKEKYAALSREIEAKKEAILKLQMELEAVRTAAVSKEKTNDDLSKQIRLLREFVSGKQQQRFRSEPSFHTHCCCFDGGEQSKNEIPEKSESCNEELKPSPFPVDNKEILLIREEDNHGIPDNVNSNNSCLQQHYPSASCEAELERNSHRDTLNALEASENSFLFLLKNLLSSFEMKGNLGLQSVAHISQDERDNVILKRKEICQQLLQKIQNLRQQLERKQELLQDYEGSLGQLRKAEELAVKKNREADSLTAHMLLKTEETDLLRDSLNKTKLQLQQEKRLNSAIKHKKTFHLENEKSHLGLKPVAHHCYSDTALSEKPSRDGVSRKNTGLKSGKREQSMKNKKQ